MKCPFCQAPDSKVIDSRGSGEGFVIRRRRLCTECGNRFTTYEQLGDTPITVTKKDGTKVPFDKNKIRSGLEKACYKRPVGIETLNAIAAAVEAEVLRRGDTEISTSQIGEIVMEKLRALDQVAYVRFASVYREFQDVRDFAVEIKPMLARKPDLTPQI